MEVNEEIEKLKVLEISGLKKSFRKANYHSMTTAIFRIPSHPNKGRFQVILDDVIHLNRDGLGMCKIYFRETGVPAVKVGENASVMVEDLTTVIVNSVEYVKYKLDAFVE